MNRYPKSVYIRSFHVFPDPHRIIRWSTKEYVEAFCRLNHLKH